MSFWKTLFGLLRRKSVGIPVIALSLLAGAATFLFAPVKYVSTETLFLTTPTTGGTISQDPNRPTGLTNPLLNFDNGLKITSGIIIQAANTPAAMADLTAGEAKTTIAIDDGRTNPNLLDGNGPFVYIVAKGMSAEAATAAITRAEHFLREDLFDRQKALNAPAGTYITLVPVVGASVPAVSSATKAEYAAMALVGTLTARSDDGLPSRAPSC